MRRGNRIRLSLAALGAAILVSAAGIGLAGAGAATSGKGIVVIETTLGYEGGRAAGTGLVIRSTGEILTNNHVIRGATAIKVIDPATARAYPARVAGYDVADDVAVLRLQGAARLEAASLEQSAPLQIGQLVTAVGNAGGTGRLRTVAGQVTGLSRAITASDDEGDAERLTGLIETSASVVPGDSGGALENAGGRAIGMITAASGDFVLQDVPVSDGYAIPIAKALRIARVIESEKSTPRVHVGPTAFLGISLAIDGRPGAGVPVAAISPGGAAAKAGLESGDVIVRIGSSAVGSPRALRTALLGLHPGQKVRIAYRDLAGAGRATTVTLGSGPPQ